MNWVRENKFLTGFIAVLVIGAGVLGYLLYSAWGAFAEVSEQYTGQANQLNHLQGLTPYPDAANLAKYKAERDSLIDATHSLATSLSGMVLPVEPLTPSEFQDRLRDAVAAVVSQASKTGVGLPEHFALDFDKYETQPPAPMAAGPLGRQLAALQIAMDIFLNDHVDAVTSLKRTPLPQENGGGGGNPAGHVGYNGGGGPRRGALVEKYSFDVNFTSTQPAFQQVLNDFAACDKQFFITRTLVVENSNPKSISKADAAAATPTPAPTPDASAGQPAISGSDTTTDTSGSNNTLRFLVGTEKVNVAMRIDMVTFNPPEGSTGAGRGVQQ